MDGPNDEGRKFKQVHKVDGPHKRSSLQSTMWTDPMTRVENLNKSTTWTGPTKIKLKKKKKKKKKKVYKVDGHH